MRSSSRCLSAALALAACSPAPPPARYDRPFDGTLKVLRLPGPEANRVCNAHLTTEGGVVAGCMLSRSRDHCTVVINTDVLANEAGTLRHEIGHCNGWPFDHPR